MSELNLKNDLRDCLIDFNKRLLVSDLVQQYTLPYKEVHETLTEYICGEEKRGEKYEKRYLVHGQEKDESKEVYTVVQGGKKLRSWLDKLKNVEHMLYSVEQVGGAKTPAQVFKPVQHCIIELKSLKMREGLLPRVKIETKAEPTKTVGGKLFAKKTHDEPTTSSTTSAGTDNTKESITLNKKTASPPDEKKPEKQSSNKKGIGNFFSNFATKKEEKKDTKNSSVLKPSTPKKVNDFFKTQNEKLKASTSATLNKDSKPTNTSVQLFEDDEVKESSSSSDEEENLEILRRDIITSEIEESPSASTSLKRGRIIDSDEDDEEPLQKKQNKNDDDVITVEDAKDDEVGQEEAAASETYIDDEGFLITVKSKKPHSRKPAKSSPPTEPKKSKEAAAKSKLTAAAKAKTKQGSITSFFNKK